MSQTRISRRQFIAGSARGLGGLLAASGLSQASERTSPSQKPAKPNFILIVADDMGYDDLGVHGNKLIDTPNLETLAAESVQFRQFIVSPVCAPTRAALLTGRQFLRTGVSHVHGGKDFLNLNETTIAEVLGRAGYATGMWGKWHSGKTSGYFPWERGFDEAYMAGLYKHRDNVGLLNGKEVKHTGWTANVLTDYCIEFIKRNKDKPFFAYLPYLACHAPLDASEELTRKYQAKGLSKNLSILYAMLDNLDSQIGRLLKTIDESGLAENTFIIFTSDNGPAVINDLLTDEDRIIRYVNHFRGHKGNMWENGVRVPLFIRRQGKTRPAVVEHLVDVTDIFPTLLDLADIPLPQNNLALDGRSIKPYILGGAEQLELKNYFNYASPGWPPSDKPWTAEGVKDEYRPIPPEEKRNLRFEEQLLTVRNDKYKLLTNPGETAGAPELVDGCVLIDIENDPLETTNLCLEKPDVAQRLKAELQNFWHQIINDPGSFAAPVFEIGVGRTNLIYAYGLVIRRTPSGGISPNLKNAAMFLWGWKKQGDYAEYQIKVTTPGQYRLEAHYDASDVPNATLQVSTENATTAGKLTDKARAVLGVLNIREGRSALKVTLLEPANADAVNLKLKTITFTPIQTDT